MIRLGLYALAFVVACVGEVPGILAAVLIIQWLDDHPEKWPIKPWFPRSAEDSG